MNIAVYCGSALGNDEVYTNAAKALAFEMAQRNIQMVYGGSSQGLMGVISNEALKQGVDVTGVIPHSLVEKEIENKNNTRTFKVNSMSERKVKMEELSDAFIAMPGGYGTFDEIFEVISELQLGRHNKACAFYNINGYYNELISFLKGCVKSGFIQERFVDMIIVSDNPQTLLEQIEAFEPVKSKWS